MNNTDKQQLFKRIAEGDKKAFDTFFQLYYSKLIQFAALFVNDRAQAEDIVADVLVNMLTQRERAFTLEYFEAYLYRSVRNRALSATRRQTRINHYANEYQEAKPSPINTIDPYKLLVEQELHTLIRETIQNFPAKRKMVFQLTREENFSYRQVADLMEISERTVEVHLRLAIQTLRQRIERYLDQKEASKADLDLVKELAFLLLFSYYAW